MGYKDYDGAYIDYELPDDAEEGSKYREWREPDGSLYRSEEMQPCCSRVISGAGYFDAEIECPACGAFWAAA